MEYLCSEIIIIVVIIIIKAIWNIIRDYLFWEQYNGEWHEIETIDNQTIEGMNTSKGLLIRQYEKGFANFGSITPVPISSLRIVKDRISKNNENWIVKKRNIIDRIISLITFET